MAPAVRPPDPSISEADSGCSPGADLCAIGSWDPFSAPAKSAREDVLIATARNWWRKNSTRVPVALGVLALAVGAANAVTSLDHGTSPTARAQSSAPSADTPPSSAPTDSATPTKPPPRRVAKPYSCAAHTRVATDAVPVRICIPVIGVNATVLQLGLNADRTVQVPPLSEVGDAGWYRNSPAPGEDGPTIILGHINSAQYGPGVFVNLGRLHPGAIVSVARADGAVATFRISRVGEYSKTAFPTQLVYGNTAGPTVRLITCGGTFNSATRSYEDNIVAFGELISVG
jgi:sortase (surface protein transpeptidase)